jgi:hypothetical protein
MRFFLLENRARLRMLERREAFLILVRTSAVLAVVATVLRPRSVREEMVDAAAGEPRPGGSRGVILIADTSYSMTYREGPRRPSALETAKEAALGILGRLSAADEVLVVTAESSPRPEADGEGGDVALAPEEALRAVRALEPAPEPFRLLALLDRAAELALGLSSRKLEVWVFTDLQASVLPEVDPARIRSLATRLRAGGRTPTLRLIDCGAALPFNRFVSSLEVLSACVERGAPAAFRVRLEVSGRPPPGHPSAHQAAALSVALRAGETRLAARTVEPSPSGVFEAEIEHVFQESGDLALAAELAADGLAADDSRHLALEVLDSIPVLVAGEESGRHEWGTARYAMLALYPEVEGLPPPAVSFRPQFARSMDLAAVELDSFRVVILCDVARLDEVAAARVDDWVRGGGGLIVFAGGASDLAALEERLFLDGRGLLPARPGERVLLPPGGELPLRIADTSHPSLAIFSGAEEGDLSRVRVRAFTRVSEWPPEGPPLAWIGNESPWLLERRFGRGKVLLVATSATLDDSDLPRLPLFLPFLHQAGRYLAGTSSEARNVLLGDALTWTVAAAARSDFEVVVETPWGETPAASATRDGDRVHVRFSGTRAPGLYRLSYREKPGGRTLSRLFAASVPAAESRLERVAGATLEEAGSLLGIEVRSSSAPLPAERIAVEVAHEHWPVAALLAVLLLLLEIILARGHGGGRGRSKAHKNP